MSTQRRLWVGVVVLAMACGCVRDAAPEAEDGDVAITESTEEARAIAKEAYVYAYPMLENYRTLYTQAIDKQAAGYQGPFNELHNVTHLLDPSFKDVVRPNNDTVYSFAWLDLRAQPLVISVPALEGRYYSVQLVDMFTNNIGYIGTRSTGTSAGNYMVTGPNWKGAKPENVRSVFESDSEFVYCIIRTEVRGPADLGEVTEIQRRFHLTPLSVFLGRSNIAVPVGITFPRYVTKRANSAGFIDYLNLLLTQVRIPEHEAPMMQRFGKIGIEPGMLSASTRLPEPIQGAVDAGVGEAIIEISKAALDLDGLEGVTTGRNESWVGMVGIFGSPEEMQDRYLVRAAAAMFGLYGNDAEEAYYPIGNHDAVGNALDGRAHKYIMRFAANDLPPVEAFWSMTMYGLPDQLMVANPIDRYSIGDRSGLGRGEDGSITIYIQHEVPPKRHEANWLPAPDGPFSLQFRMYLPATTAIEAPLYLPPPVQVAN